MTTSPKTRAERDTFGPIDVPADKLWGAQTQRSLQNFDISGEQQPREIIKALAQVKRASAVVNHALGLHRARMGSLDLPAELAPGQWRWLTAEDMEKLKG